MKIFPFVITSSVKQDEKTTLKTLHAQTEDHVTETGTLILHNLEQKEMETPMGAKLFVAIEVGKPHPDPERAKKGEVIAPVFLLEGEEDATELEALLAAEKQKVADLQASLNTERSVSDGLRASINGLNQTVTDKVALITTLEENFKVETARVSEQQEIIAALEAKVKELTPAAGT